MKKRPHQTYASALLLLLLMQTAAGCSSDTDPAGEGTVPSDTASAAEAVTEDDYGILPLPKYDAAQDGYYTLTSNAHTTLLAIPRVHGADDGDIGIVVDALSYLSYVDVEPMYAETYLENRYLRDEDSVEMLNIVIQNKTYDAAFLLNYGNANALPQECSSGRGDNIASTIESKRKAVEKEVEKALQSAEDMQQ